MATFTPIVTTVGQGKIAAAISGGPAINISHLAIGDGNGNPVVPTEARTGLVREVERVTVTSAARDPNDPTKVIVNAKIPVNSGPYTIREVAIFTSDNAMFAMSAYPDTFKPTSAQGALVEVDVNFVVVVSETANVTIQVDPANLISLAALARAPFIAVNNHAVNTPPASPVIGDTYTVGSTPTGAWVDKQNYLAQWNGSIWSLAVAYERTVVGVKQTGAYYRRTSTGWALWDASQTEKGLVSFATPADIAAGTNTTKAVSPSDLQRGRLMRTRVRLTTTGAFSWTVPAGITAVIVKAWGAGGGGGFGALGACASGGSSGAYSEMTRDVTPGQSITGSVGGGGAGSGLSSSHGANGGNTTVTIGSETITAYGGQGGRTSATVSANSPGTAIGSNGDLNLTGGQGRFGFVADGNTYSGQGGDAPLGGAGGIGGGGTPSAGTKPGGGGGGSGAGIAGASGANGEVWIEY